MKKLKTISFIAAALLISLAVKAQTKQGVTHSGQHTGQPPFPVENYTELPNPTAVNPALWENRSAPQVSWGSTYVRYKKEEPMPVGKPQSKLTLKAWKGERVSSQFVVSAAKNPLELSYEVSDLVNKRDRNQTIDNRHVLSGFVRYVMTDEVNKDKKGACGYRDNSQFDSTLVADVIDHRTKTLTLQPQSSTGVWLRVWVPQSMPKGQYAGTVTVKDGGNTLKTLSMEIEVTDRVLPQPSQWAFHLDLWQNPFAVARYYGVEPWSDAHFDHLRTEMQHYVDAGGKVITASIMHKPWNGQTYDYFETMVTWMKKADGTWLFDYTVFDKWVEFMMEMGVTKQINCYSMVPWRLSFQYFDQASNSLKFIETSPGEPAFEDLWVTMLSSFANHLKTKGWFDKTYIAMDERPMEAMIETLKVIRKADKNFKTSLAGNLHEELVGELDDYCIALRMKFTDEMKKERKAAGMNTTFYTCCAEPYPNTFTFSPLAESEWLPLYAARKNLDGYLRWALNSWVLEPLLDSRFTAWAAGDTYLLYPGGRSSMRFEKLMEGIQNYEKVRFLKEEFEKNNNQKSLRKIEKALSAFDELTLDQVPALQVVKNAREVINAF